MNDQKRTRAVRFSLRTPLIAGLAGVCALAGCSSSSMNESSGDTSSGATSTPSTNAANCSDWTQSLDAWGGGIDVTHVGASASLTFELMSAVPAPPALGTTTWTLKLTDASGAPVKDATFPTITPWMPQHSHGSTALPTLTNNGDGTYDIKNLYLFMPGVWQVTLDAKSVAASTTDSAVFTFCMGGS